MDKTYTFEEIKKKFADIDAWGLLSSIDLYGCGAEKIRSKESVAEYARALCDLLGVKRYGECLVVNFGENERVAGLSLTQLIETSLVSGHFVNLTNAAYIDIFSCKLYDPVRAAEFTKKFFEAREYTIQLTFRK